MTRVITSTHCAIVRHCHGCDRPLTGFLDELYDVCMDCTKARHRAVVNGKCTCGRKAKPGATCKAYSRTWIPCQRCLGTIRQVS